MVELTNKKHRFLWYEKFVVYVFVTDIVSLNENKVNIHRRY